MKKIIDVSLGSCLDENLDENPVISFHTNDIGLIKWVQNGLLFSINQKLNEENWADLEFYSKKRKECDDALKELEEVIKNAES